MIRAALAGAALAFAAAPMAAQQVSFRLGGLHARYADSLTGDAGALGARLTWERPRARAMLDASYAWFSSGGGALQAWGNTVIIRPMGARAAVGLRADGVANGATGGLWTGSASGGGFGSILVGAWTATLGASLGGVRAVDSSTIGTLALAMSARRPVGPVTISAALTATTSTVATFADATLSADWHGTRLGAGLVAGARAGDLSNAPWLQGYGQYRITPLISLEAAAGSYPQDLSGFAHGFYFNAGIRISLPHGQAAAAPLTRADAPPDVVARLLADSSTRVTFVLANATSVAIVGSWNDWTPMPLDQAGRGRWTIVLPVGPGTWRFALVMADGTWIVPNGVTSLPDDFGGQVGVLVVNR